MDNSFFYPIHDIILDTSGRGVIVGKNGSLTYVVKLHLPEVYSLYKTELEVRHSAFTTAFSKMPDNSYVHKQDVFLAREYQASDAATSYLGKADQEHFAGRKYFSHTCMIGFTLANLNSLSAAYEKNIFSFKENLRKEDCDRLEDFLTSVEFAINHISSLRNTRVSFLSASELQEYLFASANFYETKGVKDINFADEIIAGKTRARVFSITDSEYLPDECPVYEKDYTVSQEQSELYMSFAENLGGIHLYHDHVYNQIFYFYSDKKLKDSLRKTLETHIQNRGWDKVNFPAKIEKMEELVKNIKDHNEVLCYAHFSILIWDNDARVLDKVEKQLRSAFDIHSINYYMPSFGNLANIYGGGILGCTASLERCYMFQTSLSLAVTFLSHYTIFRDDPEGLLFNDRLYQIPLRKDIWDAKSKRIKARNAIVIAPTGAGKSFTTNNIVQQLLDQEYTIVAVEFGNSFKQLCYLYPEISIHVEYDEKQPLGINAFDLDDQPVSPEKIETLVSLCLRLWRQTSVDVNQTVALRKFITQYYRTEAERHSFQGFYKFLKNNFTELCKENEVNPDFFKMDSFLHVCSEFMPGGAYANLCESVGVASHLSEKRFIHFELTKVKSSPFVSSVVMSLLFDVINNKILSDPSKKGYIIFDEYAETAQMKSLNPLDINIHQAVATFYQKIRKENGAVMTIIQSPVQLPDNEFTKGIISNTQLLYVLEGTDVVYDAVVDTFKIKNESQVNQMKSIQNNYSCSRPYSECWIRFGQNYAITVRIEASQRKYLAFQTQGEIRAALDKQYASNGHDMKLAIEEYIKNLKS